MTQSVNSDGLTAQFLTTDGAVNNLVIGAVVHAVSSDFVLNNDLALGVTQCGNGFLSNQDLATDGAVLAFGQTSLGAGSFNSSVDDLGVTQSVDFVSNIGVAAEGAGVGGVAILGAGGSGDYRLIFMLLHGVVLTVLDRAVALSQEAGVCALGSVVSGVPVLEGAAVDNDGAFGLVVLIQSPDSAIVQEGAAVDFHGAAVLGVDDIVLVIGIGGFGVLVAADGVSTAVDDNLTAVCPDSSPGANAG